MVEVFSSGALILDDGLGIQYSGPQPIAASASATMNGAAYADSPGTPLTANLSTKSANENRPLTKDDGAPAHHKPTTPSQPAARGDSALRTMLNSAQSKREDSLDAVVSYTRICGCIH